MRLSNNNRLVRGQTPKYKLRKSDVSSDGSFGLDEHIEAKTSRDLRAEARDLLNRSRIQISSHKNKGFGLPNLLPTTPSTTTTTTTTTTTATPARRRLFATPNKSNNSGRWTAPITKSPSLSPTLSSVRSFSPSRPPSLVSHPSSNSDTSPPEMYWRKGYKPPMDKLPPTPPKSASEASASETKYQQPQQQQQRQSSSASETSNPKWRTKFSSGEEKKQREMIKKLYGYTADSASPFSDISIPTGEDISWGKKRASAFKKKATFNPKKFGKIKRDKQLDMERRMSKRELAQHIEKNWTRGSFQQMPEPPNFKGVRHYQADRPATDSISSYFSTSTTDTDKTTPLPPPLPQYVFPKPQPNKNNNATPPNKNNNVPSTPPNTNNNVPTPSKIPPYVTPPVIPNINNNYTGSQQMPKGGLTTTTTSTTTSQQIHNLWEQQQLPYQQRQPYNPYYLPTNLLQPNASSSNLRPLQGLGGASKSKTPAGALQGVQPVFKKKNYSIFTSSPSGTDDFTDSGSTAPSTMTDETQQSQMTPMTPPPMHPLEGKYGNFGRPSGLPPPQPRPRPPRFTRPVVQGGEDQMRQDTALDKLMEDEPEGEKIVYRGPDDDEKNMDNEPTLRPKFIVAGGDVVKQTKEQEIINEICFNAFDYVPENGYLGKDNKVWNYKHQNEAIRFKSPLGMPRSFEMNHGPIPLPIKFSSFQPIGLAKSFINSAVNREKILKKLQKKVRNPPKVLPGDLNEMAASHCLRYWDKPTPMHFAIDTSLNMKKAFDPAGIKLQKKGFKSVYDTQSKPMKKGEKFGKRFKTPAYVKIREKRHYWIQY